MGDLPFRMRVFDEKSGPSWNGWVVARWGRIRIQWAAKEESPDGVLSRTARQSRRAGTTPLSGRTTRATAAWYHFCRKHQSIKTTPAVAAELTNEVWTLKRLLE
jgi:hypothetical protein